MGYTENESRTFVLKMHLHCKNNAKDVKKLVREKINGVNSVDVIDQEQGKVRISGNVEPRTVIVMLKSEMKKHAELLVEEEEEEKSPPRTNKKEMQIVNKPVREFVDQRKVSPLLPENESRTFVLKMHLHCKNNAKDVKKLVREKINGVNSVDVIDQEQGKVRISGNVEPRTVIVMLKSEMKKHAELLVEEEEEEKSPPRTNKKEMQIVNKPVREFVDQRKVSPLLPENESRTFVLKMHLHCKNNAKDMKKLVREKINGVGSVDVIDQEQGKVRISGNVEPRTVIEMLKSRMKKHAELLVEDEEEESPPRTINQEMQIVNKPVRKFVDQHKVSPLLPDPIIEPLAKVRDCYQAHNHELKLKSYNKPFTCNRCMEDGFTSGYRCMHCVYDIHKECKNPKPKITHKLFPGSVFEFRKKPHIDDSICDACGLIINGYSYRCEAHKLDLHPRCCNLPQKLRIDRTDFTLICKNVEQRCSLCKKKLHSQLVEKEVPGWCYVSERDKFYCHVYCVSQMVHAAWRRRGMVPNDDDNDNDGTFKPLEKVNLTLVSNSNGRGGRGGRLFLKFLRAIVGILFGDPFGLIEFAVELVQN